MPRQDNAAEVREFLRSRRARLTPGEVGLPEVGRRRVPGLRRGEVAALAGVSIEYYNKLERGALAGASNSVLESIARALRLDEAERDHLLHLAQAANGGNQLAPKRRARRGWKAPLQLQWVLDAMTDAPAVVGNGRMDLLASNPLGHAMHSSLYERSKTPTPNFARYIFLDEDSHRFYPDWDSAANTCVSILRMEVGRDPGEPAMRALVGELSTVSHEFAQRWSRHDVRLHGAGAKHFHHMAVGELELSYETMALVSTPGLSLTVYAAKPGSPTAERLALLACLVATHAREEQQEVSR